MDGNAHGVHVLGKLLLVICRLGVLCLELHQVQLPPITHHGIGEPLAYLVCQEHERPNAPGDGNAAGLTVIDSRNRPGRHYL